MNYCDIAISYNKGYEDGKLTALKKNYDDGFNKGVKEGLMKSYYYGYLITLKTSLEKQEGNNKITKLSNKIKLKSLLESDLTELKNLSKLILSNLERIN